MTNGMKLERFDKIEGTLLVQFDDVRCIAFGDAAIATYEEERIVWPHRVRVGRREYVLKIGGHDRTLQQCDAGYTVRRQILEVDGENRYVTGVRLGGRMADDLLLRSRMVVIG